MTDDVEDSPDLCRLCIFPATQAVQMRPKGWAALCERKPYPIDLAVCGSCGEWLTDRGYVIHVRALATKVLR